MGTDDHPFNGIFDGADYTVDYMHINATAEKYAGLVGKADGAEIKNIKIGENSRISSAQTYLGAVAGAVSNTLVTNCHNAANLTSTAMYAVEFWEMQPERRRLFQCVPILVLLQPQRIWPEE